MIKGFFCGGDEEIRTLERLLTPTRFPVVRPRPSRRHLQIAQVSLLFITALDYYTKNKKKNQVFFQNFLIFF